MSVECNFALIYGYRFSTSPASETLMEDICSLRNWNYIYTDDYIYIGVHVAYAEAFQDTLHVDALAEMQIADERLEELRAKLSPDMARYLPSYATLWAVCYYS